MNSGLMRRVFPAFATGVLLLTGCGGGASNDLPDLVPVTGTVTQDGKPLSGAVVTFEPATGGGISAGLTDDAGKFELLYLQDLVGAVEGAHTVRISKMNGDAGDETIPEKFNRHSELMREVKSSGTNDFQIEI